MTFPVGVVHLRSALAPCHSGDAVIIPLPALSSVPSTFRPFVAIDLGCRLVAAADALLSLDISTCFFLFTSNA
jgi:hypothetical protein